MVFTSILLVILNSNFWFCFILIFYVYDSKFYIIYAIPINFRCLVLIVASIQPVTMSLFFSQHNGVVSPSLFLVVIFLRFSLFSCCPWVQPIVGFSENNRITFLSDNIIAIYHHCFYPSTKVSFHRHCWQLLYFLVFFMDECNHSLGFLITLEVLCWAIILSLYIIIIFLRAQRHCFTVTVVHCYILKFSCDSSPRMSATTCWDRWLYWNYFAQRSYYCYTVCPLQVIYTVHRGGDEGEFRAGLRDIRVTYKEFFGISIPGEGVDGRRRWLACGGRQPWEGAEELGAVISGSGPGGGRHEGVG